MPFIHKISLTVFVVITVLVAVEGHWADDLLDLVFERLRLRREVNTVGGATPEAEPESVGEIYKPKENTQTFPVPEKWRDKAQYGKEVGHPEYTRTTWTGGPVAEPEAEPPAFRDYNIIGGGAMPEPTSEPKAEPSHTAHITSGGSAWGAGGTPEAEPFSIDPCSFCVAHAVCVAQICTCSPGYEGDGYFYCAPILENYICYSSSDPGMRTLGGENFVYHLIGSTRLVHLQTEREGGGTCEFKLWGWTKRVKGKYFIDGLSFRLDQTLANGTNFLRNGFVDVTADEGQPYQWTVQISDPSVHQSSPFEVDAFSTVDGVGGCSIDYYTIEQDFMKFDVSCCGIFYALRPYHPDFPLRVPGFWFQVHKSSNPTYAVWGEDDDTEPLCLDHTRTVLVDDVIVNTGVTFGKREALTFHAVTNTGLTEYPGAPEGLTQLKTLLRGCSTTKRDTLFAMIRFFFDNPKFSSCLNGKDANTVVSSVEGIRYTASLVCDDVVDSCVPLENLINSQECQAVRDQFPEIAVLSDPGLCP